MILTMFQNKSSIWFVKICLNLLRTKCCVRNRKVGTLFNVWFIHQKYKTILLDFNNINESINISKAEFTDSETSVLSNIFTDITIVLSIVMVFNTIFNNISVISWQSVLLVEETRVPGENHWPAASHCQILSHKVASSTPRHEWESNSQYFWW